MIKRYNYIDTQSKIVDFTNKKVIIWGKSISALKLYVELKTMNVDVVGFTDSYVEKEEIFADLPLYPYPVIFQRKDIVIYIATGVQKYRIEILELLKATDIPVYCKGTIWGPYEFDLEMMNQKVSENKNKIDIIKAALVDEKSCETFENLLKYRMTNDYRLIEDIYEMGHLQYFPEKEMINPSAEEIFIDAGAYNGATSVEFSKWVGGKYQKIYVMEPDELMQTVAREYLKLNKMHNVEVIGKGAYSENTILKFDSIAQSASSNINENGETEIQTISIDSMLEGKKATYIKMDIEGAEMEALIGAQKTIEKYRPNLAISIYHKADDLWEIPYYIRQKYPWYKLYMRHYQLTVNETVLYAVV